MSYHFATYGFLFLDDILDPPFLLRDMGIEKRTTTKYYFDNNDRNIKGYLFQYTLKGYGVLEMNNQKYKVEPGQGFLIKIPSDGKYYMPINTEGEGWQYLYFHFEGTGIEPYYNKIIEKIGGIIALPINSKVIQYLLQLHERLGNNISLQPFEGSECVFHFLILLCRSHISNREDYSIHIRRALEIIENQFDKLQGVEEIAKILGISQSHLTREFTKETGINPIKYLTNIRIQNAIQLLCNTELLIEEIALKVGFSSGNYFSKTFKRYMDISPQQFREKKL